MISVAIDGPAGAGKSTIARAAAAQLGFIYVDTGALYRSIGLFAVQKKIDFAQKNDIIALLGQIDVELTFVDGEQRVLLCGEDVSDEIRSPEVSMAASVVSAIPEVRSFLFDLQKDMAKHNNVVMDGRDIGTVVLPKAQVKIFLTASPEVRAKRRCLELEQKGERVSYEDVLADIRQRDYNDTHREIAPLKQAEDAVLVDTSELTLEESVQTLTGLIRSRLERE
ncbi:cytidylate kinase [[Clostridium] methylpentosum DSM 5476]|uniref:Cytidylate kinase n=1 Tax=[Clostridium] methylpentosum DSM 5476 TaxID=537013 RepID=C0EH02_9FIRM|nr:cytidylate kinase [[Clostridium] methylpentosum DSM 5476]MDY3989007.1 (d)CMP kinase [Massilioclostridium sp.]MEE1493014.1 (d)CMP kinase [Massilioclostridium sp.]